MFAIMKCITYCKHCIWFTACTQKWLHSSSKMTCLAEGVQACILQYLIDNIININKNHKKKKTTTTSRVWVCILQNILFR